MRAAGMAPLIRREEIGGKPFWRVVVGPAVSIDARGALTDTIREAGFSDAYAVAN